MRVFKSILAFLMLFAFSLTFLGKVEASSPSLGVLPQMNSIVVMVSGSEGELEIVIDKGSVEHTYNFSFLGEPVEYTAPDLNFVNIEPGDTVQMTLVREGQDDLVVTHEVVEGLEITDVNFEDNEIEGTRDAERGEVTVEIYPTPGSAPTYSGPALSYSDSVWALSGEDIPAGAMIIASQGDSNAVTMVMDSTSFETILQERVVNEMGSFGDITSNIAEVFADPTKQLYFESSDFGRVTFSDFTYEKLISSNPGIFAYLVNAEDLVKIAYDEESNELKVSVDTNALDFLDEYSATIEFFDVVKKLGVEGLTSENIREHLDIVVFDDGDKVVDILDYFDWDDVVYDPETDVLTLPVNHFTEYVLGEAVEEEEEVEEEKEELPETGVGIITTSLFGIFSLMSYAIVSRYKS